MNDPTSHLALIARAQRHGERIAVVDSRGSFTYDELLGASLRVASALLAGRNDLQGERVAFLVTPGLPWIAVQWGIWRAGGVSVPLPLNSVRPELQYFIDDAKSSMLVFDAQSAPVLAPIAAALGIRALPCEQLLAVHPAEMPEVAPDAPNITSERRAMILYTSGTTSQPKGVVTNHENIAAQIVALVEAWEWSPDDHILLCLPLHHIHGIINVVSCALWSGSTCEMLPRFDRNAVWDCIERGQLTLFMAVPTVYIKLIAAWDAASPQRRAELSRACQRLRLMEIEEALRQHPAVAECAVVGVADPEWGDRVAAAVVLNDGHALDLPSLRLWAKERLAAHKIPSRLLVLDALPRNAMGKVTKPAVAALFNPRAAVICNRRACGKSADL